MGYRATASKRSGKLNNFEYRKRHSLLRDLTAVAMVAASYKSASTRLYENLRVSGGAGVTRVNMAVTDL